MSVVRYELSKLLRTVEQSSHDQARSGVTSTESCWSFSLTESSPSLLRDPLTALPSTFEFVRIQSDDFMSGRDAGGGSQRRAIREPSALHSYIAGMKLESDYVGTLRTSVGFRPRRGDDGLDDSDDSGAATSGERSGGGVLDAGRLVGLSSTEICYDDGLAKGLFPVAKFRTQTMRDGRFASGERLFHVANFVKVGSDGSLGHWTGAASEAVSFPTGTVAPRDDRAKKRRHASSWFLHPELSRALRADKERSGLFLGESSADRISDGSGVPWDRIDSRGRHNRSHMSSWSHSKGPPSSIVSSLGARRDEGGTGLFLDQSGASTGSEGSGALWDRVESMGHLDRSKRPPSSIGSSLDSRGGKRLRSTSKVGQRVAVAVLALATLALYLDLRAEFETILNDMMLDNNVLMRLFGNDSAERETDALQLVSSTFPQEYDDEWSLPTSRQVISPQERNRKKGAPPAHAHEHRVKAQQQRERNLRKGEWLRRSQEQPFRDPQLMTTRQQNNARKGPPPARNARKHRGRAPQTAPNREQQIQASQQTASRQKENREEEGARPIRGQEQDARASLASQKMASRQRGGNLGKKGAGAQKQQVRAIQGWQHMTPRRKAQELRFRGF